MISRKYLFAALAVIALTASCSRAVVPEPKAAEPVIESLPYITAILPGAPETKIAFDFPNWVLKASWTPGDQIAVTPGGYGWNVAGIYTLPDGGGHSADFTLTQNVGANADEYRVFYPGDRVKCNSDFTRFYMEGQVQSKAAPMDHLKNFFAMYKVVNNYSTVDFSDAVKSSCFRVDVSGTTFKNPYRVAVTLVSSSSFTLNCYPEGQFYFYNNDYPDSPKTSNTISVDLDGYGTESSLVAWIAMSNVDVELESGDMVRVKVFCEDGYLYSDYTLSSDMVLEGGHCHSITLDSGWKVGQADYTVYPFDGEVVTLQEAGKGLDLVLMGDGFIAADFDGGDSSEYMTLMKDMADNFFTAQPYIYLKPFFNIYVVKAVSPERTNAETTGANGARNTGTETKFSMRYTPNSTSVSGDDNTAMQYAMLALGNNASDMRVRNVTVIVVGNQPCRSGTCWNSWYSDSSNYDFGCGTAIAYFGRGTSVQEGRQLVRHEASGHGFGKLGDEYKGNKFTDTGPWNEIDEMHELGFFRNTDKYISASIQAQLGGDLTTTSNVLWHDLFGTENNYESDSVEALGVYEGGYTYNIGFCRPTYQASRSIMNGNTGIFNAISRRQIYYRAQCLMGSPAGAWGSAEELAAFLAWDKVNMLPTLPGALSSSAPAKVEKQNGVEQYAQPLAAPVYLRRYWDGNKFVYE